ncbi:MAG: hypothetical protein EOM59_01250 [Clostridia bacterium]|nr:hypothetical protein [Clostridia bacterium]
MRILTVMSGVVLSATGAGCLAYYSSAFSSIAFVLGIVMITSAIFLLGAFLLSAKNRLPDTVLVEGMMTVIFGFIILNNEVTDTVVSMFFGAWLTVSGIIRFSQSLSVSRFDPKNWHKIMPLGIISAIFGFIMLMHSLVSAWNQLTLVGLTFILNGFSQLIYAMYMVNHETLPQTEQARKRVEAKQKIAEEKRKERDHLRSLGKKEREAKKQELREAQQLAAIEKRREVKIQKEKEKAEREALLEPTIRLTKEQEIAIAQEAQKKETGPNTLDELEASDEDQQIISWDSLTKEPSWGIPSSSYTKIEKSETKTGIIIFPEEQISFKPAQKPDITEILDKEVPKPEATSFTPLILEEIMEEEKSNDSTDPKTKEENEKRFTEEFSWDWPLKK